ncbi:MAG TPA: hypothetical protein VM431_15010 [Phycisphaerae bacterium]|nr:hypothetical protein [Phycisphaerae bacterium]
MRFVLAASVGIVLLGAALAWGADPFAAVPVGPNAAAAEPEVSAGAQKVSGIEALFAAAKYDEAIDAAKAFLRVAQEDGLKAEATRLVAEALRKKGDWKRAMGAYVSLRDRFEKGCDEYVRYDAMAEILRASPSGVYQQGTPGAADPATSERRDAFQNLAKGFVVPKSSGSSGWGDSNWLERGGGIGGGGM